MKNQKKKINNKAAKPYLEYLLTAVLCVVLILAQLFRGLYFRTEYMPFIFIIGIMALILGYLLYKNKAEVLLKPVGIGLMGLTAAYALALIRALSPIEALDSILKQFVLLVVFAVSAYISRNAILRSALKHCIAAVAALLSLSSLLGVAGILKFEGVITKAERLGGLYQYANTNAAVMGALLMFLLIMNLERKSRYQSFLYSSAAVLAAWAFWASESRGALIVSGIIYIISVAAVGYKNRLQLLLSGVYILGAGFVLYSLLNPASSSIGIFAFLLLTIIFSSVLTYFESAYVKGLETLTKLRVNIITASAAAALLLAAALVLSIPAQLILTTENPQRSYNLYTVKQETNYVLELALGQDKPSDSVLALGLESINGANESTELVFESIEVSQPGVQKMHFKTIKDTSYIRLSFRAGAAQEAVRISSCRLLSGDSGRVIDNIKLRYMLLPDSIGKRLTDINIKTGTLAERLVFVKDGLNILAHNALLGTGGGGWRHIYTRYQSYDYASAYAHNYYLQTAIETGVLGIIFLIYTLAAAMLLIYKATKAREEKLYLAAAMLSLFLLLHSFVDFNLSILAVAILLWASVGILAGAGSESKRSRLAKYNSISIGLFMILSAAVVIASFIINSGISYSIAGERQLIKNPAKAKNSFAMALKRDFYNTRNLIRYSEIIELEAEASKSSELLKKAKEGYERAVSLEPNNLNNCRQVLSFYIKHGYYKEASRLVDRALQIQPLAASSYELKSVINSFIYEQYMLKGNAEEAVFYRDKVLEIERDFADNVKADGFKPELSDITLENINKIKSELKK